jgi:AraC-like DNA-binding protein
MPTEHVLHSVAIGQVMLNFAAERGVEQGVCLAGTDIDPACFHDPEALITPEQEMRLIGNLIEALADVPALGFEVGMQYTASVFGIWGYSLVMNRNLKEATELSLRYAPLSTAYCHLHTEISEDEFAMCAVPSSIPEHLRQFLLERDLGTAVNVIREIKLQDNPLKRLEFTGSALPYAARIEELAGIPVVYNSARNALVLSLEDALRPLPLYNEQMVRLFEDQCRQLMESRRIGGVSGQVRKQLLGKLGLAATLGDVASELHMSSRNLRRKLVDEDLSFRAIQDQLREQLACQLLETTEMTLDELALRLGYTDTASFTRAFRRWKGVSPGKYRAQAGS